MVYISSYKTQLVKESTTIPQFTISCPEDVIDLMVGEYHMDSFPVEEVWALFTDVKSKVIGVSQISRGGLSGSICDMRSIFSAAIHSNASGVLLVHNHPSGDSTPSIEDRDITKRLVESGRILGFSVLDHMIIGRKDNWFSFASKGELS